MTLDSELVDGVGDTQLDVLEHGIGPAWHPDPWWAWTLGLLAAGAAALLAAGVALRGARLGTALQATTCSAEPLGGLVLLVVGGVLLSGATQCARLRARGAFLIWDPASWVLTIPIPVALLAATLPGTMGCRVSERFDALPVLGDALVGSSGTMVASATAVLLGAAIGAVAQVAWVTNAAREPEQPGIVELAMQEAEALQADAAALRFHGVDSGD